jgi:hypothetical protein
MHPLNTTDIAWLRILAALAAVGLLVTFHQVVRGAVQQGESRRIATAVHAESVWRCKALGTPLVRDSCLLQARTVAMVASVITQ